MSQSLVFLSESLIRSFYRKKREIRLKKTMSEIPALGFVVAFKMSVKRQSNEIFDPHLFSSFEPAGATDQWVQIFSILVKILQS